MEFVGNMIENGIIKPSETNSSAVQNFSHQKNIKQMQWDLGMTGYFCKFIADYARIATQLSHLFHKGLGFEFGPEDNENLTRV